jgi:hypothetical protein
MRDIGAIGLLGEVAAGAGGQGLVHERGIVEGAEQDDVRRQVVTCHRVHHVEAVEPGHLVIDQRHRRLVFPDGGKRGTPVAGLGDHPNRATLLEGTNEACPVYRVVIGHDDGDVAGHLGIFSSEAA